MSGTFPFSKKADKMGRTPPGQTRERVFRLVRDRLLEGRPPTTREVQRAFRFRSVQTAREHLEALVREGRLTKRGGQARGYGLPRNEAAAPTRPTRHVPLVGSVSAGGLDAALQHLEGYLPVEARRGAGELFALRVRGESMTGAGILPGDLVVVRRQPTAESGDVVVALIGDEATVKRLRLRGKRVELHPENPDYEPIVLFAPTTDERVELLGKVVEVRRSLERS
jgi:repressor LexA